MEEWTTAQIALVVSGLSFALAFANFIWSIWSKFIYPKPKMQISIAFTYALGGGYGDKSPSAINLTATNHGPTEITLKAAIGLVGPKHGVGKTRRALLKAYRNWPYTSAETDFGEITGLPFRLPVGEQFSVFFPESLLENREIESLGFTDGFGREHFADRKSNRQLRKTMRALK